MAGASHGRLRLFPTVVVGLGLVAALKVAGLAVDGGFSLLAVTPATAQGAPAAAEGVANADQGATGEDPVDVTTTRFQDEPQPIIDGTVAEERRIRINQPTKDVSAAERAVLESLRKRREELDARAAELEMRENLLQAAEQRVDDKLAALKALNAKIQSRVEEEKKAENERFASLVSMYENMKPKDAARIFNRLETGTLVDVASRMNPRKLAPVLSKMDAASAERLTMEIARTASSAMPSGGELEAVTAN